MSLLHAELELMQPLLEEASQVAMDTLAKITEDTVGGCVMEKFWSNEKWN